MNKFKSAIKQKEKVKSSKSYDAHQFGDFRWDFIKYHVHDLSTTAELCPMCQLVTNSTKQFFAQEELKRIKAREENILNRVTLRYNLLRGWARNQSSIYADIAPDTLVSEIYLSGSVVIAVSNGYDDHASRYL